MVFVDPAYTSQCCPSCGTTTKQNRKIRDKFQCISCSLSDDADIIEAINIASRVRVADPEEFPSFDSEFYPSYWAQRSEEFDDICYLSSKIDPM